MTYEALASDDGRKPLTLVDLQLDKCGLTYGTLPCRASIPGNLLEQSEEVDGAYYTRTGLTDVLIDNASASDGTITAEKLRESAANSVHSIKRTLNYQDLDDNTLYTFAVELKASERTFAALTISTKASATPLIVYFNLGAGTVGTTAAGISAVIQNKGSGWYRCFVTVDVETGILDPVVELRVASADGTSSYAGTLNSGIFASKAQVSRGTVGDYIKIGGQRNILQNSEQFDDAYWTKTNLTLLANNFSQYFARYGTVLADRITETTANGEHNVLVNLAGVPLDEGATYTLSIFAARANTRQWLRMSFLGKDNVTRHSFFNLSTISSLPFGGQSGLVNRQAFGKNGSFARCSITFTIAAGGTTPQVKINMASADGTISYVGSTAEFFYIWGIQLCRATEQIEYEAAGAEIRRFPTGTKKCFTTFGTCQDRNNFDRDGAVHPVLGQVKTLLHFDGTDASTTFTDSADLFGWSVFGNAQLDTAQSKFGSSSALFDGTIDAIAKGYSTELGIETGDFTIEFWMRPNSVTGQHVVVDWRDAIANTGVLITQDAANGAKLRFQVGDATAGFEVDILATTSIVLATWHHIALVRDGNTFRTFIDGVSQGTAAYSGTVGINFSGPRIGSQIIDATLGYNGWIDEFRITKGSAVYTAPFTPPIVAFPDNFPAFTIPFGNQGDFAQRGTLILAFKTRANRANPSGVGGLGLGGGLIMRSNDNAFRLQLSASGTGDLLLYLPIITGAPGTAWVGVGSNNVPPGMEYAVYMISWDAGNMSAYRGDAAMSNDHNQNLNGYRLNFTTLEFFRTISDLGELCCLYFNPLDTIAFSELRNRRRVIDAEGNLKDFGLDGSLLTGKVPLLYFRGNAEEFLESRGTLPGELTPVNGASLVNAESAPPWAGARKLELRLAEPHSDLPIVAFPCVEDVALSPTVLAPDRGLGQNAAVSITLRDFPYHDRGIDPYVDERDYDPEEQGTFFGRLMARNRTSMPNRRVSIKTGFLNSEGAVDEANFQNRRYEIDRFEGPDRNGKYKLTCKDPLKRISEKKAQAPFPSRGSLSASITSVATSASMLPVGIGDTEYPLSGKGKIGSEVVSFTRSGDTLSLTRGQHNTTAAAHSTGDTVQLCLEYTAMKAHNIVHDLYTKYSTIPLHFIDKDVWDAEADQYLINQFSTLIPNPTPVDTLIKELTEHSPFYTWWDERNAQVRLKALKPPDLGLKVITDAAHIIADTIVAGEDQEQRVSQVWILYGQIDPTKSLNDKANFACVHVEFDTDSQAPEQYGTPSIRTIYSRWIASVNKPAAEAAGKNILTRFKIAPRKLEFELDAKDSDLWTGDVFMAQTIAIQDAHGAPDMIPMQVLEVRDKVGGHSFAYKALEFRAFEIDRERRIVISIDQFGLNIRDRHDLLYGPPTEAVDVIIIIEAGIVLGSTSPSIPAFLTGLFPEGSTLTCSNFGRIQGAGGDGGNAGTGDAGGNYNSALAKGKNGQAGGDALVATFPITFDEVGAIWGGGGGGGGGSAGQEGADAAGGGGGGGGCGFKEKIGANRFGGKGGARGTGDDGNGGPGTRATDTVRGNGGGRGDTEAGLGGVGGNIASAGAAGGASNTLSGGTAGAAGRAIVGSSFVTLNGAGDIRGAQV